MCGRGVMHIVRVSEVSAINLENSMMSPGSKGWTTRLALHRQLFHAEKQSTQSMHVWTNSIRELARKISDLGGNVSDDELTVVLTQ